MVPDQELLPFPPEATWIGSDHPFDLQEAYLRLRSPAGWRLAHLPQKAELFITADSRYKLWVNGGFVARGPARTFPQYQAVDRLDITAHLTTPENCLAVQVYQPGYSHFAYVHRGAAGLLACLVCDGTVDLVTRTDWRVRRDESFSPQVPRISIYGSGVEERDLRLAERWLNPDFDDRYWPTARLVTPVGGWPWTALRPRGVPLLEERELPAALLETRIGPQPASDQPDPHQALREGWSTAKPVTMAPDDHGWHSPQLAAGEAAYWLFDLGRDHTCQGWAEIKGAGGQEQLSISYAEKRRQGQLILPDPQTYCRVRLTDRFRLRPGDQVAETFTMRGGRYLLWQLIGPSGSGFRFRPQVRVAEYPLKVTRPLETSDELLVQIIHICETTVGACLQDGFVDCVWRESSQWLGDALPQSLALWAMTDDIRPLRQIIVMAAQGAYPDGILPSVVPGEVHAYTIVRYNFMWVELLHFYRQISGDDRLIRQLWPTLQRMLATVNRFRTDGNLLYNPPGRRFYVDWSSTSQDDPHVVYNLHFILALQKAGQLAAALDLTTDANRWQAWARDLQVTVRQAFLHHNCWTDDLQGSTYSQLAAALAILTQTAEPGERPALLDAIASRSLDTADENPPGRMVLASPFMHHYLFEALRQEGRFEQVVDIIRFRWGRWAKAGFPTTWENWDVDFPDGSQCHSFSAHPRYHLAEINKQGLLP
jgi:hypothetical protein